MEKSFIRIGNLVIHQNHIIEIHLNLKKWNGHTEGYKQVVRIVTSATEMDTAGEYSAASRSTVHDFDVDSPEAKNITAWAKGQATVLL